MKKLIIICTFLITIIACNSNDKHSESPDKEREPTTKDNTSNPDYQKGLSIIAKSDCLICHKIDSRVNGPSYREVAEKYAGASQEQIADLAQKIIKGGTGVWGSAIMNPHPTLSREDAEAMVKYILLLKK
jgi:cytochrome c